MDSFQPVEVDPALQEILDQDQPAKAEPVPMHYATGCYVSKDLSREELFELGRKGQYHKYVNFPVDTLTGGSG